MCSSFCSDCGWGQWGPADVIGRGRMRREERGGLEEEKGEEEEE